MLFLLYSCNKQFNQFDSESKTIDLAVSSIDSLIKLSEDNYTTANFNDSLFDKYLEEAFSIAKTNEINNRKFDIYTIVGKRYRNISEFGIALYFYQKALEISNLVDNDSLRAYGKHNMAVVFRRIDDNAKALNLHFQALEWAESVKDTFLILSSNNGIGNVYFSYKNLPKAIEYFQRSLKLIYQGHPNKLSEAINSNNIGEAWLALGNADSALFYINKSYKLNMEMNSKIGKAICENAMGDVYVYLKNYKNAIPHYKESRVINEELGNLIYVATNHLDLGKTFLLVKDFDEAGANLKKALKISKEIGSKSNIVSSLSALSDFYKAIGKERIALNYLDEAMHYKDSITKEVSKLNSDGMSALYKTEKQEREIIILKQRNELTELLLTRQRWAIGGSVLIILGGMIFSIYFILQRRRNLKYNLKIQQQHNDIRDSIRYAQKIQTALLPDFNQITQVASDYFVYYKPRDMVSGDFYWLAQKENVTFVAVADCTGHGVPGALMSMLGIAFLNEIVNQEQLNEPNLVLNRLREQVVSQLKQKGNLDDSKDGIEMTFFSIDHTTLKLKFAGAYNNLYIVRDNNLIQLKADRMPIGYHPKKQAPFGMQEFDLQKGDCLYSTTDGYYDQFGGSEGTKFLIKKFTQLLVENSRKSMSEQCDVFDKTLKKWQGKTEQIDDIVVVGIRI